MGITQTTLPWLEPTFSHLTYYLILGLFISWVFYLVSTWNCYSKQIITFLLSNKIAILITLLISCIVFITVPLRFRILSDETNQLSIAKTMTFEKRVDNITEGKWYHESFWPTSRVVDSRPFLFPFMTHLSHLILGYNPKNVFVVNFFCLWLLLLLVFTSLRAYSNSFLALAGIILVSSQSMITLCATSGSYCLLNTLFIGICFANLYWFLKSPTKISFQLLIINLLMLAHIRNESIIFLFITFVFLAIGKYLKRELIFTPAVFAAPIFLLPILCQQLITSNLPNSNLTIVGGSLLSSFNINNLIINIPIFCQYIFDVGGDLGYAGLINLAGFSAMAFMGIDLLRRRDTLQQKHQQFFFTIVLANLMALFELFMLHYGAINNHPLDGRYLLSFLIILSIFPMVLIIYLKKNNAQTSIVSVILAIILFAIYHPNAMEDKLTSQLYIGREYRLVKDFMDAQPDKNILMICNRPGQLIIDNFGAISFASANAERRRIQQQYNNHLHRAIYTAQAISYKTNAPLTGFALHPAFHLKPISGLQITKDYYLQISQVEFQSNSRAEREKSIPR